MPTIHDSDSEEDLWPDDDYKDITEEDWNMCESPTKKVKPVGPPVNTPGSAARMERMRPVFENKCGRTPPTSPTKSRHLESRTSSTSSIWSETTLASSAGSRKRSLESSHSQQTPISAGAPSAPKVQRTSQRSTAASSSTTTKRHVERVVRKSDVDTSMDIDAVGPSRAVRKPGSTRPTISSNHQMLHPDPSTLNATVIAHSKSIQKAIDALHLSWGVQYEIARGVSRGLWQWSDVTPQKLDQLVGTDSEAAPRVAQVIKNGSKKAYSSSPIWKELEREQKAIMENKGRGLGLMGPFEGEDEWYGGRIQQIARLVEVERGSFEVHLEKLEMRRSNRFGRFLGSRRMLQLRVLRDLLLKQGDQVRSFFCQKFVLCGRVFVPFHSKENNVYMVETNENYERTGDSYCGDQYRTSFEDFIRWHNPLECNKDQSMSKWSTRFALGLSNSVPALLFSYENIFFIDDQYAPLSPSETKAPAEKIMTDGCGYINGSALALIKERFRYGDRPTAIQGRIAGAKGLWTLHPEDRRPDGPPRIWIRKSQEKIKFPEFSALDRARYIFDLVGPNRVITPSRLSQQTIMNLSENDVPDDALTSLLKASLDEEVKRLTAWEGPGAMHQLWDAVNKAGRITGARLQRHARGTARALGLAGRDFSKGDLDSMGDRDGSEESDAVCIPGHADYSGSPLSVFESAMELIQAGFQPLLFKPLYDKLKYVLTYVIDSYIRDYHIVVPESAEAFIIPDPLGILEEGEVYFRATRTAEMVVGPVLVYRNPTRVASDIQKVNAVNRPELADYYDVIVFSTKGKRSLASYLGGGDYDGDTVTIVSSSLLVGAFTDPELAEPPPGFQEKYFHREIERVDDFSKRVDSYAPSEANRDFQRVLLLGLADTKVGIYSRFHDIAVYKYGYSHPETIRLAYMFTTCLDSSKTGLRVKKDIYSNDDKNFHLRLPKCMETAEQAEISDMSNKGIVKRQAKLPKFILDVLLKFGQEQKGLHLSGYESRLAKVVKGIDKDLTEPFGAAERRSNLVAKRGLGLLKDELQSIKTHVDKVHSKWFNMGPRKPVSAVGSGGAKSKNETLYQVLARELSMGPETDQSFAIAEDSEVELLKASYAYGRSEGFAMVVAFKHICAIKSRASGPAAISRNILETMAIVPSFLRAFGHDDDDY